MQSLTLQSPELVARMLARTHYSYKCKYVSETSFTVFEELPSKFKRS